MLEYAPIPPILFAEGFLKTSSRVIARLVVRAISRKEKDLVNVRNRAKSC